MKKTISLLAIILFGFLATGCSLGGSKEVTPAPTAILLRIWRVDQDVDSLRTAIQDFQGKHPKAIVTYKKKKLGGYEFASLKSLAARQGPDVWSIPHDWLGDEEDIIQPLPDNFFFPEGEKKGKSPSEAVKELFPAGIVEQISTPQGKVYGMPTNVDSLHLYFNHDLMDAAVSDYQNSLGDNLFGDNLNEEKYQSVYQLLKAPPATWSDLVEQTKYFNVRGSGGSFTRSAIALGTADNTPNANDILFLLMLQNETTIISLDHKSALFHIPVTTPTGAKTRPGENALDFFASFSNPAKSTYSWNPSMPPALDAFGQGKLVMVIAFADFETQLKAKYPKFWYETAAVPQISTSQDPVNLIRFSIETVTKTANNQAAAFTFLKNYTGEESTNDLASEKKLLSPYLNSLDNTGEDFLSKQVSTGKAVYKKQRAQFDEAFRQMIIDVSQNGISAGAALDNTAQTINQLLNAQEEK